MSVAHGTVDDADEFEDLIWEFSDSELDLIDPPRREPHRDDDISRSGTSSREPGELAINVQTGTSSLRKVASKTPMALRRSSKHFNVTQLISTAWCELQVDYALRHRRDVTSVENLAPSFVSRHGNTIAFTKSVAIERSKVLKKGAELHEVLEKEVHPVVVQEPTASSKEEAWTNRLLGMISAFNVLQEVDACRELEVFGFVQNNIVFGCIDEIVRAPNPSVSGQTLLYLLDSKTRAKRWLPPSRDTVPGQLQLMLYHRLLSDLMFPPTYADRQLRTHIYDFDRVYRHLGLKPWLPFSKKYFSRISAILGQSTKVHCLGDVVVIWENAIDKLRRSIDGISNELEIVYRLRAQADLGKRPSARKRQLSDPSLDGGPKRANRRQSNANMPVASSFTSRTSDTLDMSDEELKRAIELSLSSSKEEEEANLMLAIAASLLEAPITSSSGSAPPSPTLSRYPDIAQRLPPNNFSPGGSDGRESLVQTPVASLTCAYPDPASLFDINGSGPLDVEKIVNPYQNRSSISSGTSKKEDACQTTTTMSFSNTAIINTKTFMHDPVMLDDFLEKALAYWHGQRDPQGVDIEDVGRCRSCEYIDGCEWLKLKAEEHQIKVSAHKSKVHM